MIPPISCRTTHINNTAAAASILFAGLNITQSSLQPRIHRTPGDQDTKLFLALCKVKTQTINICAAFSMIIVKQPN